MTKFCNDDIQILELFYGQRGTDLIIAKAHQIRGDPGRKNHGMQLKIEKIKKSIQEDNDALDALLDKLVEVYGNRFKSNELLTDLIIGYPRIQHS